MGTSFRYRKVIWHIFSCALFVVLWWFLVRAFRIPEYLIPYPKDVFQEVEAEWGYYFFHFKTTALEASVGFMIAMCIAWGAGIILYRFRLIRDGILPSITALQAIPIVALAPLYVVWLGSGFWSKSMMAVTIAFFPTLTAILAAFEEVDEQAKNLFLVYRASYSNTLRLLLIPASLPNIVAGMQVSAGLATVGAIVAEMTGSDSGIGFVILNASYRLQTVGLFAGILLAGVLGIIAYTIPGVLKLLWPKMWANSRNHEAAL